MIWVDERGAKKLVTLGAGTARCGLRPGRAEATPLQRQATAGCGRTDRLDLAGELLVVED